MQKVETGDCCLRRLAAKALLSEANQRLADVIKSKHFNAVPVAQGLSEIMKG